MLAPVETSPPPPARREPVTPAPKAEPPAAETSARQHDEAKSTASRRRAAEAAINRPARARLSYDRDENRTYVEVLDPRSGEVLFRFPPEAMAKHLEEQGVSQRGQLFDQPA